MDRKCLVKGQGSSRKAVIMEDGVMEDVEDGVSGRRGRRELNVEDVEDGS